MFRLSLDLVLAYRLIQKSPGSECRCSLLYSLLLAHGGAFVVDAGE